MSMHEAPRLAQKLLLLLNALFQLALNAIFWLRVYSGSVSPGAYDVGASYEFQVISNARDNGQVRESSREETRARVRGEGGRGRLPSLTRERARRRAPLSSSPARR